jgi:HK97 family phage major capsid protein
MTEETSPEPIEAVNTKVDEPAAAVNTEVDTRAIDDAIAKAEKLQALLQKVATPAIEPATQDPVAFQSRSLAMVPGSLNEAARTVDVVLTTTAPVRRTDWNGDEYDEVLDMAPKSVRLERMNRGAPFLDSHDYYSGTRAVLGTIVPGTARVQGEELLARVKFSRSDNGERVWQDVKDGVLRNISIGYVTHSFDVDKKTSPQTRRAVDWEPHEGSVVAIPADPRAGFRGLDRPSSRKELSMNDEVKPAAAPAAVVPAPVVDERAVEAAVAAGVAAEMARREEIATIARGLGLPDAFAAEHVAKGSKLDEVRALAIAAKAKIEAAAGPVNSVGDFTFESRDARGFPAVVPASALKTPEPGQRAAQMVLAVAAAKRMGVSPVEVCAKRFGEGAVSTRALQASIGSTGGYLIPIELSSELIELLRPRSVVRSAMPAGRVISLPRGNLTIGRQNTGATVGYIGEGQSTAFTQQSIGEITLQAKKAKAIVPISNDLIRFAQSSADMIVRDDLVRQLAVLEDQNFLRSAGSQWAPKGLKYLAGNTTHATVSSYSVTTAISDLTGMVNQLQGAYVPMTRPTWFWSHKTMNYLYDARDSVGGFLFRAEMDRGSFRGFPFFWTQNIPNNLGGSTNQSEIYLADMDEVIIGDVPGFMIDASQEASYSSDGSSLTNSAFDRDETVVRIIAEHDMNVKHTAAITVLDQVPYGN